MARTRTPQLEWTIVTDTREQAPWLFTGVEPANAKIMKPFHRREGLTIGDYAAEVNGALTSLRIERKSKSDLYQSLTRGRERLEKRIAQALEQNLRLIVVVEDSFAGLYDPPPQTDVSAKVVIRTMLSWTVRWGIAFYCPGPAATAEKLAFRLLEFSARGTQS